MTQDEYSARVAALNDEFRRRGTGGRITISEQIKARGSAFVSQAKAAVQADEAIDPELDPTRRHDFGRVTIEGVRVCWKIDYQAAEDPRAPLDLLSQTRTLRVLSIFTPLEY